MQCAGQRHVIPMQLQLDVLPPQLIGLIDQRILDEDVVLLQHLGIVGAGRLHDFVPQNDLIPRIGLGGILGHDIHEQLLDVPVKGRSEVGMNVKREEGPVHSAVRFERSEGVEAEVVNDGLGPVGVAVFAQCSQNGQSQQDGQTEEHHGI